MWNRRFYRQPERSPHFAGWAEKLEYRGYDSAGIAVLGENGIHMVKASGMIKNLDAKIKGGAALPATPALDTPAWPPTGSPRTSMRTLT